MPSLAAGLHLTCAAPKLRCCQAALLLFLVLSLLCLTPSLAAELHLNFAAAELRQNYAGAELHLTYAAPKLHCFSAALLLFLASCLLRVTPSLAAELHLNYAAAELRLNYAAAKLHLAYAAPDAELLFCLFYVLSFSFLCCSYFFRLLSSRLLDSAIGCVDFVKLLAVNSVCQMISMKLQ